MAQVDINIRSRYDGTGIEQAQTGAQNLERRARELSRQWQQTGRELSKKFSLPEVGKQVLGGLGFGSGFAVAQKAADIIVQHFREAAEVAQKIEASTERQRKNLEAALRARRSPEQNLAADKAEAERLRREIEQLQKPRTVSRVIGSVIRGDDFRRTETYTVQPSDKDVLRANELTEQLQDVEKRIQDAQGKLEELGQSERDKRIQRLTRSLEEQTTAFDNLVAAQKRANDQWDQTGQAAAAIRAQTSESERYKQQVAQINALRGVANGLTNAEADAAIARLDAERQMVAMREDDRVLSGELGRLSQFRAEIENNNLLTRQEKEERILPLLEDENKLISARLEALREEAELANDPKLVAQLQETIDRLQKELAGNKGTIAGIRQPDTLANRDRKSVRDLSDPTQHYQSAGDAAAGSYYHQLSQIGTLGDQIERTFTNVGNSIRQSMGGAIADILTTTGSGKDKLVAFGNAVGLAWINSAAQMVADWIYQHTVMAAFKKLFVAEDIAATQMGEAVKTGVTIEGAAARTAVAGTEAATTTGITVAAAGTQASATGIAGVFRSIMELGPIAGPLVFGAAIAGMVALVSQLAGFEKGGFPQGRNAVIRVNENGQEAILNANATRTLGVDAINKLNAGMLPDNIASALTPPDYLGAVNGGRAYSGGSGGGYFSNREVQVNVIDYRDHNALEQLKRDTTYEKHFVELLGKYRSKLGIRI